MRKLVSLLPLLATIFASLWNYFDPVVWVYLSAHPSLLKSLVAAFVLSETLAGFDFIKSNSVAQAIFDLVDTVLRSVTHQAVSKAG